jgi:hypothetical protein
VRQGHTHSDTDGPLAGGATAAVAVRLQFAGCSLPIKGGSPHCITQRHGTDHAAQRKTARNHTAQTSTTSEHKALLEHRETANPTAAPDRLTFPEEKTQPMVPQS